jgi:exopolysaccharide biosynthesis protein
MRRATLILASLLTVLVCSRAASSPPPPTAEAVAASDWYEVTRHLDPESNTHYFLTRIRHRDAAGNIIKLRHAHAIKREGETVRAFAQRLNTALAFNASMGYQNLPPGVRQPVAIQIVDGVVLQDLPTGKRYTLGIRDDNELVAYPPGTKAQDIVKDGVKDALTAFIPLIENHARVSSDVLKLVGNSADRHPRQVIAQFDNRDILFLSCGGRGFDGDGMKADDLIRILERLGVRFAFNLDGGGSTSTVVGSRAITKKIDSRGTEERPRPNFLYILAPR